MSHLKQRKEKNCLNCQTEVIGRYCHSCGQENLEPKETVWHLVQHFFNDITHFDGKFFESVKYLLRKPGFLSLEYMRGRRMSYLNPIRLYVFTSAIFFIILFSIRSPEDMTKESGIGKRDGPRLKGIAELMMTQAHDQRALQTDLDKDDREDYRQTIDRIGVEIASIKKVYGDSTKAQFTSDELKGMLQRAYKDSLAAPGISAAAKQRYTALLDDASENSSVNFGTWHTTAKTVEEYDSIQSRLPESQRDGWLKRTIMRRTVLIGQEWKEDPRLFTEHLLENIFHSFPKILFISLPIFALILNILYYRHKQYYYVDHGIFTIHVYCATFILLLVTLLINRVDNLISTNWFHVISVILIFAVCVYMMIYLYKAMRGFYQQRRGRTFVKYFITFATAGIINLILLSIFLLISVFSA